MKHETAAGELLFVGSFLALTGGFLDAYTYVSRGGVFANAQTGNLVLMGIKLADGEWLRAVYYLVPILAFLAGILLTERIKDKLSRRAEARWEHSILILEIALMMLIGFVPTSVPNILVNTTVSFICSIQVHSFRTVAGAPYASTMCTGNMRSAMEQLYRALSKADAEARRKVGVYACIVGLFCVGAGVGARLTALLGIRAVWCCCALLAAAGVAMRRAERTPA